MRRFSVLILILAAAVMLGSGCRDKDISEERGSAVKQTVEEPKSPTDTPAPPAEFIYKSSAMDIDTLKSPEMNPVEKLTIYGTGISAEIQAMVDGKRFKNLKELHLSGTFAGNSSAVLIANSEMFSNLKVLSMSRCDLGDEGAKAIADSKFLKKIEVLNLSHNKITDGGIIAIKDSKTLDKLKSLNMKDNWIQPKYGGGDALEEMRGRGVDVEY